MTIWLFFMAPMWVMGGLVNRKLLKGCNMGTTMYLLLIFRIDGEMQTQTGCTLMQKVDKTPICHFNDKLKIYFGIVHQKVRDWKYILIGIIHRYLLLISLNLYI